MFKRNMTVGEYLDAWLETIIKTSVRYNTYISYKGYINNHIKRFLGHEKVDKLKTINIQYFVGMLVSEQDLSPRTIGIIVRMMCNAFSCAEDYELLEKNPCKKIKLPKVEESEIEVYTNFEQTLIEKEVLKSQDKRNYGILLTLYTGLRIGELCALKWTNIDFKNKYIHIKKSLNRMSSSLSNRKTDMIECEPKTKNSKRLIHLPCFIVEILSKLKEESNSEFIFSMKNGSYVHPRTMQRLHMLLLKRAGVKYCKFHALRHTFATRVAELNADPKTVSETLGHSSTAITLNRYTHSLAEQKQKMMNGLDKYFKGKKI